MSLEELWKASCQTDWIKSLNRGVPLRDIIQATKIPEAVSVENSMGCCDGRCPRYRVSIAGVGILIDEEVFEKFLQDTGVTKLISHENCGAVEKAYKGLSPEKQTIYGSAEAYAKSWTKKKAEEYGLEYRHIEASEFCEPVHHERGIIIDTTLEFYTSQFNGMPNMFVSNSSMFSSDKYISNETAILTDIAFGDHGFGNFFTRQEPFYIIIIARDSSEEQWLATLISSTIPLHDGRVVIKSYSS